MSDTIRNARAIQARLGRLMGTFAGGKLLVRSEGDTGLVPAFSFAIPVPGGAFEPESIVFVPQNRDHPDGHWPVTKEGALVPVQAVQGGSIGNMLAGTPCRWSPVLPGVEPVAEVGPEGITGGAPFDQVGTLRQLVMYKQLTLADAEQIFRAQTHRYPAIVLSWERTSPLDGPMSMQPGPRPGRVGGGAMKYRHFWIAFIISERVDGDMQRREEGDILRDNVIDWLSGALTARGLRMSIAPGAEVLDASVLKADPGSYIDVVRFQTIYTQSRRSEAEYNDWKKTWLRQDTRGPGSTEDLHIPDITVSMEPPEQPEEGEGSKEDSEDEP